MILKFGGIRNSSYLCTALRDVSALKDAREGSIQLFIRNGKAEIKIHPDVTVKGSLRRVISRPPTPNIAAGTAKRLCPRYT